jgi:signal peptidase I
MFFFGSYSLHKLKQILQHNYKLFLANQTKISEGEKQRFKTDLLALQDAIDAKDKTAGTKLAKEINEKSKELFKTSWFKYLFESGAALAVALIAAVIIRAMWFELYEIPTGSMRPTFREQDLVSVSKTTFGLNVPLATEHFYFNPDSVKRGGILIFSADNLELRDVDTNFLYIFPYKKRFVKRLIGKPGDTLYFYGGSIYGFDKDGHPIDEFKDPKWMKGIDYIPFITFEGKERLESKSSTTFLQMNKPVGKTIYEPLSGFHGEVFDGKNWIADSRENAKGKHDSVSTLSDLWGMGNYAKVRLSTKDELLKNGVAAAEKAPLYLEIFHHPSFGQATNEWGNVSLVPELSILPIDEDAIKTLMGNMYTARFIIKNGKATRYDQGSGHFSNASPDFKGVPDGTYEFYYGKGYSVGIRGYLTELPPNHPLMQKENLQKLFNLGIEVNLAFSPVYNRALPSRYAYFKDGDLYVMGGLLFKKDDPALVKFVEEESAKAKKKDYLPFVDAHPPLNDKKFIEAFGLKIPEKSYLVLGDNHSMSGDSRIFGFVPEDNIQGAPSLILAPPNDRMGFPNMPPYPLFNWQRIFVWILGAIAFLTWWFWRHKELNRRIK